MEEQTQKLTGQQRRIALIEKTVDANIQRRETRVIREAEYKTAREEFLKALGDFIPLIEDDQKSHTLINWEDRIPIETQGGYNSKIDSVTIYGKREGNSILISAILKHVNFSQQQSVPERQPLYTGRVVLKNTPQGNSSWVEHLQYLTIEIFVHSPTILEVKRIRKFEHHGDVVHTLPKNSPEVQEISRLTAIMQLVASHLNEENLEKTAAYKKKMGF